MRNERRIRCLNKVTREVEKTLNELGLRVETNGNITVTSKTLSNNFYNKAYYFACLLEEIITILKKKKRINDIGGVKT